MPVSQPGRQERLAAVLTDCRLAAGDPHPLLLPLLERDRPLPTIPAQHAPFWPAIGQIDPAIPALEHQAHVATNANANPGEKCRNEWASSGRAPLKKTGSDQRVWSVLRDSANGEEVGSCPRPWTATRFQRTLMIRLGLISKG